VPKKFLEKLGKEEASEFLESLGGLLQAFEKLARGADDTPASRRFRPKVAELRRKFDGAKARAEARKD
jgi:hypothetical protein